MQVETGRLIIHLFSPGDWQDLRDYLLNAEVVRFESCLPKRKNVYFFFGEAGNPIWKDTVE